MGSSFVSMVHDDNQIALLKRCKFIGIKNDRFCVAASDYDFVALKLQVLKGLHKNSLIVLAHSCLYSTEPKLNNISEEEVGEYLISSSSIKPHFYFTYF